MISYLHVADLLRGCLNGVYEPGPGVVKRSVLSSCSFLDFPIDHADEEYINLIIKRLIIHSKEIVFNRIEINFSFIKNDTKEYIFTNIF